MCIRDRLELALPLDLSKYHLIDIVGTGGDGKNTFNISTLSSFIVAGTGQKVAKHGNYGASSVSGSSNVMEQLGYKFSTDITTLSRQLDSANICFLHAPLFHPALKAVAVSYTHLDVYKRQSFICIPASHTCSRSLSNTKLLSF